MVVDAGIFVEPSRVAETVRRYVPECRTPGTARQDQLAGELRRQSRIVSAVFRRRLHADATTTFVRLHVSRSANCAASEAVLTSEMEAVRADLSRRNITVNTRTEFSDREYLRVTTLRFSNDEALVIYVSFYEQSRIKARPKLHFVKMYVAYVIASLGWMYRLNTRLLTILT